MQPTVTKNNETYDQNLWVVTHLNFGKSSEANAGVRGLLAGLNGHSGLLVEGLEESEENPEQLVKFFYFFDIRALPLEETVSSLDNTKGIIIEIRAIQNPPYDYSVIDGASYVRPADGAKRMCANILREKEGLDALLQNICDAKGLSLDQVRASRAYHLLGADGLKMVAENEAFRYQKYGKHALFTYVANGDNCTGWCNRQMAIAGIGDGTGKPKPKVAAGQCAIL